MISDKIFNLLSIGLGALAFGKAKGSDLTLSAVKQMLTGTTTDSYIGNTLGEYENGTFFETLSNQYKANNMRPDSNKSLQFAIENAMNAQQLQYLWSQQKNKFEGKRLKGGGLVVANQMVTSTPMGAQGVPGGIPIVNGPLNVNNFNFAADPNSFYGQQAEATRLTLLDIMQNKRFSGVFQGTHKQKTYQSLLAKLQGSSFGPMDVKGARRALNPLLNTFSSLYGGVDGMADVFSKRLHGNRAMTATGTRGLLNFGTGNNTLSNVKFLSDSDLTEEEAQRIKNFEKRVGRRGVDMTYNRSNIVEIDQKIGDSASKKFRYAQYRVGSGENAESIMMPIQELSHYKDASTGAEIYHRDAAGSVMYSPTGRVMQINKDKTSEVMTGLEYLFGRDVYKNGKYGREGGAIMGMIDKSLQSGRRLSSSLFGGKDVDADDQYKILQYIDPVRTPSRALSLKAAQMKVVRTMNPMDEDLQLSDEFSPDDSSRVGEFDEFQRQAEGHGYVIEPLTSPNQTKKDIFNYRTVQRGPSGQVINTQTPDYVRAALGEVNPDTGQFYSTNDIGRRPGRHIISAYNVQNRGSQRALKHMRATLGDLYAFRGSGAFADMEKSGMIGFVHGSWLTTKRSMKENPQAVPEGTRIRVGASEGEEVVHPGRHFTIDKSTKGAPATRQPFQYNEKFKGIIDIAEKAGTGDAAARQAAIRQELQDNPIFLDQGDWLGKSVEGDNLTDVTVDVPGQGRLAILDVIPGTDDYTFSIGRVSGFGEGTKTFGATTSTESSLFDEQLTNDEYQSVKDFEKAQKDEFFTNAKQLAKTNRNTLYDQEVQRRAPEVDALKKALDQLTDKKKAAAAQKKIVGERRKFTRGEERKIMGNLRGGALEKAYENYKTSLGERVPLDQERELLEGLPEIFPTGPKGPSMTKRVNKNKKSTADLEAGLRSQRERYTVPESELLDAVFPTRPSFGKGTETGSVSLFDLMAERDQLLKSRKQKPPRVKNEDFQARAIGEVQALFNLEEEAKFWERNQDTIKYMAGTKSLPEQDRDVFTNMYRYFGGIPDGKEMLKNSISSRLSRQQKKVKGLQEEFERRGLGSLGDAESSFRSALMKTKGKQANAPSWMQGKRPNLQKSLTSSYNGPGAFSEQVIKKTINKYLGASGGSSAMVEELLGISGSQRKGLQSFFSGKNPFTLLEQGGVGGWTMAMENDAKVSPFGMSLGGPGIPRIERNKSLMPRLKEREVFEEEKLANADRLRQLNRMIGKGKTIAYKAIAGKKAEEETVKQFGTVAAQTDLKPQRDAHIAALKQIKEELADFKDQLPGYDSDATHSAWSSMRDSVRTGKANEILGTRNASAIAGAFAAVDPSFAGSTAEARTLPHTTFIGEGRNFIKGDNIRNVRTQQESAIGFLLNKFDASGNPLLGLRDIRNYAGDITSDAMYSVAGGDTATMEAGYKAFHAGMKKGMGESYSMEDTNALIGFLKRAEDAFIEDPSLMAEREQLLGNVFGFEQGSTFETMLNSNEGVQALVDLGIDKDFVSSVQSGIKNSKMVFNLSLHGVADSSSITPGNDARMERRFIDHIFYQLMDSQNERHGHMKKVWETIQQRIQTFDPSYVSQLASFAKNSNREIVKQDRVLDFTKQEAEPARRTAFNRIKTKGGFLKHEGGHIYIPSADDVKKLSLRDSRAGRNVEDTDLQEMITEVLNTVETNIADVDKKAFLDLRRKLMDVGARKGMEAFNAPFEGRLRGAEYGMVIANLDDKVAKETQGYGIGMSKRVIEGHFDEMMRGASASEKNYLKKMKRGVLEEGKKYAVMGWQNPQISVESVSTMAGYYDPRRDKTGGYTANILGEKVDIDGQEIWKRIGAFISGKTSSDFDGDTAAVMAVGAGNRNRSGKNIKDYWEGISDLISAPNLSTQYQRQKNYDMRSMANEKAIDESLQKLLTGGSVKLTRKQTAFMRQVGQEDVGIISNTARALHKINYVMRSTGGIDRGSSEEMSNFLQALEQKAVGFKHMAMSPRKLLYSRFHSALENEDLTKGLAEYKSLLKDFGFRDADKIDETSDATLGSFSLARASILAGGGKKSEKTTAGDILNSYLSGSADSEFALHQLDSGRSDMLIDFAMSALPEAKRQEFKKKVTEFKDALTGANASSFGAEDLARLNATEKAKAAGRGKNSVAKQLAQKELKENKESAKSLFANKFARAGMVGAAVTAGAYALFNSGYDDEPLVDVPPPPPGRMMMTPTNADMKLINSGNLLSDNYSNYNQTQDEEMARSAGSAEMSGAMSSPNSIASKSYLNNAAVRISNRGMIVDKTNPVEYARSIQGIIPGAQVGVKINHNYNIPSDLERQL
jgi:hypothetical protein